MVNHSGVTKDLNALGLLCLLLDRNLFRGTLVSSRPNDRIDYDNNNPDVAPQLHKAGGMSGPFATVLVAPLPSGSMETQLNVLLKDLKARLQRLEVADIREDVRKGCFIKLTDGEHAKMLKKPKFRPLGEMPNCWEVRGRSNANTTVNVDILPPVELRSAAGMEQVAAEKLGAELVDAVLEQAEAESTILAAMGSFGEAKKAKEDGQLQQAISKAIAKLEEAVSAESDEAATPAALIRAINAAIAKATEVGVLPEQINTAAAEARIKQLEEQQALKAKEQAISKAIAKLEEAVSAESDEAATPAALIRAINAAIAKATEVGILPEQINTAAAEARIKQLEEQQALKAKEQAIAELETAVSAAEACESGEAAISEALNAIKKAIRKASNMSSVPLEKLANANKLKMELESRTPKKKRKQSSATVHDQASDGL